MPSIITRKSTEEGVCTLNKYLAGKDPFRAATRGIPCPPPYRICQPSENVDKFPSAPEIYHMIHGVLKKYKIQCRSMGVRGRYQKGHYGARSDTWDIYVAGDDPTNYRSAVSEIEQILLAAGTPEGEFRVEICNGERGYNDESTCLPDDPSLIAAISKIQPRVLDAVRKHIPNIWALIAYHMRGRRVCKDHERKPSVIIFCKPRSKLNWSKIEKTIAAEIRTESLSNVQLHLEILPGQIERSTVPFITHEEDVSLGRNWSLHVEPDNRASIGVHTKDKRISFGTLGGWVRLQLPGGRSAKCILTAYDVVRDGDLARRTLNDHNGIGLHGIQPQSAINVQYPAPLDAQATKASMEKFLDHKDESKVANVRKALQALELVGKELGDVVYASGRQVSPSSNRVLEWALVDSPSTFKKNVTPTEYGWHSTSEAAWVSLTGGRSEFIQQMASFKPGDKLTCSGRGSVSSGFVNRIPRRIRWDDGTETEEDEVLDGVGPPREVRGFLASRGDVGSWVVEKHGKLVGMIIALDIWTGPRGCTAFVTPIKDIVQHIEATTGGRISLPSDLS